MKVNTSGVEPRGVHAIGFVFLAAVSVFAQKQNSIDGGQAKSVYAELTRAPEMARNRPNPLEGNPDALLAGRKLFGKHCAECHGSTAEGTRRGPTLRDEAIQHATPGTLFWVLTNGVVRRGMPVWSKLPEPQRWQIVTYLESLRTRN
jgi:mono/diheme cytochrome c family protein